MTTPADSATTSVKTDTTGLSRSSDTGNSSGVAPFSITVCRGGKGGACRFVPTDCRENGAAGEQLARRLHSVLARSGWAEFLRQAHNGTPRHHHAFRIAVAACPNGCSRPHIADMGLIHACDPSIEVDDCIACGKCIRACPDKALRPQKKADGRVLPALDTTLCQRCGHCVAVCPTGAIACARRGWRVLLGGRLGRHPRLARELDGLYSDANVADLLHKVLAFYMKNYAGGKRFGVVLDSRDFALE
jgi:Pyruvate/2-oxoacid:ferredoxin oxidoreductase delta subunit